MKIAFIGLGNMGGGMAANLVKAGHEVQAFDLSAEAAERATGNGCTVFPTVREAVQGVDAVVSMLPNGAIVEQVYAGDVIGHAPAAALLLDCSTIDVDTARKVASAAAALTGCPPKVVMCPSGGSNDNTCMISLGATNAPIGIPPPKPLASNKISGRMPYCSKANKLPVRP